MKVYEKITGLIGGTPLLKLTNYQKEKELGADKYAKDAMETVRYAEDINAAI